MDLFPDVVAAGLLGDDFTLPPLILPALVPLPTPAGFEGIDRWEALCVIFCASTDCVVNSSDKAIPAIRQID